MDRQGLALDLDEIDPGGAEARRFAERHGAEGLELLAVNGCEIGRLLRFAGRPMDIFNAASARVSSRVKAAKRAAHGMPPRRTPSRDADVVQPLRRAGRRHQRPAIVGGA